MNGVDQAQMFAARLIAEGWEYLPQVEYQKRKASLLREAEHHPVVIDTYRAALQIIDRRRKQRGEIVIR